MRALKTLWSIDRDPADIKPASEPSPFTDKTNWQEIAGPHMTNGWPDVRSFDIKAIASFQGKLYAGIRAGLSYNGDDIALVYEWDGKTWRHVGGDGVKSSWAAGSKSRIQDLDVINGKLYAAIGGTKTGEAEFWRFDGNTWGIIAGNGKGWKKGEHDVAYSIAGFQDGLVMAVHSYDFKTPPAVYFLKDDKFTKIAGDGELGSWPANDSEGNTYAQAYEFAVYRGELYLSMTAYGPRMDIWRFNGKRWQQIAGHGINESWKITSTHRKHYLVTDLLVYQDKLIATLAFWGEEAFHPIWAFDGETWKPVGNKLPPQWKYNRNSNNTESWHGRLYVGIQNPWIGASMWEYGDNEWRPVLGYGKYGSWGQDKPPGGIQAYPWHGYVYRMIEHDNAFIAALGSEVVGGAQIWRYAPK